MIYNPVVIDCPKEWNDYAKSCKTVSFFDSFIATIWGIYPNFKEEAFGRNNVNVWDMHQLIQWHNSYSVFVKVLDNQHKRLFEILNELYDDYMQNTHQKNIGSIITQLLEHASLHFATEEDYFRKCGFEEAAEHKAEHQLFMEKLKHYQAEYNQHGTTVTLQIIDLLQDWLHRHILERDKKYIDCFKKLGLK